MILNRILKLGLTGFAAFACAVGPQAGPINGTIAFSGQLTLDAPIPAATRFTSFDNVVVQLGTQTGDYVGTGGSSVTMLPWQFDPVLDPDPVTVWSFVSGGVNYSFDLYSPINVVRLMIGDTPLLAIEGDGLAFIDGFDPTPGDWTLTTQGSGVTLSFSASTTAAAVPDGGNPAVLMGMALLGLAWFGRKQQCGLSS